MLLDNNELDILPISPHGCHGPTVSYDDISLRSLILSVSLDIYVSYTILKGVVNTYREGGMFTAVAEKIPDTTINVH